MTPSARPRLLVVSGLSGAGKTVVLHALEDHGFYCVDNLPVSLLPPFLASLAEGKPVRNECNAVGIDARNQAEDLENLPALLAASEDHGIDLEVVFIRADEATLLKRFSETRRRHPLTRQGVGLEQAIARERALLEPLMERADLVIDTSKLHLHQLRSEIRNRLVGRQAHSLSLQFVSFGFKHGVPTDADFVFDMRALPNPHWQAGLRDKPGTDPAVMAYLDKAEHVAAMVGDIRAFLDRWVPVFEQDDRAYLTVAIGCTGGRHRSVFVAERLAEHFIRLDRNVLLKHRDL